MAATQFTSKKRATVLARLSDGLSVTAAMAGMGDRTNYYRWREEHPDFAEAADAAIEAGTDRLEDIAKQRAEETSDTLLIFLLKARRRDKYGDRQQLEHSGKDGAPIIITFGEDGKGPA